MTYEEAVAAHRWNVPERYNIAADVCDKHPRDKPAMVWEDFRGEQREVAWGELQSLSNRAANVLRAHGVERGDRVAVVAPATPETAAIFIATGQDAANVAESSAALVFAEHRSNGDFYYSVTIPSLIVATYGGGTGLPTQRECLEMLGCYGAGKVGKLAEIVAATVLCGEISLGSAIVSEEWVKAHDLFGRNRP